MDNLTKTYKSVSHNANSRNRRKVLNGFKGEGTPSGWVKTTPYGSYKHEPTLDEIRHSNKVKKFYAANLGSRHPGSKRTINRY